MNYVHYVPEDLDEDSKVILKTDDLEFPFFVGQGWSSRVGSDVYGGYVAEIKKAGKKTVYGLVRAHTVMSPGGWTAGDQECSMPEDKTPTSWIVQSGWSKEDEDGHKTPKFFFCDRNGIKFRGRKCCYSWNGAYSYRDPSF